MLYIIYSLYILYPVFPSIKRMRALIRRSLDQRGMLKNNVFFRNLFFLNIILCIMLHISLILAKVNVIILTKFIQIQHTTCSVYKIAELFSKKGNASIHFFSNCQLPAKVFLHHELHVHIR